MSLLKVFAVYDSKVEAYTPPFFLSSKGEALRAFADIAKDKNHRIGKHPADYTLFELGDWDEKTAQFTQNATPVNLGVAIEFVGETPKLAVA